MGILLWIYLFTVAFALGGIATVSLLGYMLTGKVSRELILRGIGFGLAWPFIYSYLLIREIRRPG